MYTLKQNDPVNKMRDTLHRIETPMEHTGDRVVHPKIERRYV